MGQAKITVHLEVVYQNYEKKIGDLNCLLTFPKFVFHVNVFIHYGIYLEIIVYLYKL